MLIHSGNILSTTRDFPIYEREGLPITNRNLNTIL